MDTHVVSAPVEIDDSIFAPFSPEFIHDPAPTWERLNTEFPVAYHRGLGLWIVSTHDLNFEWTKSPLLTPSYRAWEFAPPERPEAERTDFDRMNDHALFTVNPTEHMRLRKLTVPAFSKLVMDQIEEKIRDVITEVFEAIGDADEIDVFKDIAAQIPIRAITRMVGVPKDAEDLFENGFVHNLVLTGNPTLNEEKRLAAMAGTLPGIALMRQLIEERRARHDPGDDFLGTLVGTVENGDRLSDMDIISLVGALISAGADTVTDLHTCALQALLSHRDQWQLLQQQPELMEAAVLEILRWGAPGKTGLYRFALQDCVIGGQLVAKGKAVMLLGTAAWNDAKRWPEPRRFDITRPIEGNIVFGAGPHFCIGLNLVKVQGKLMIEEFTRRFPKATLTGEIGYDYAHHNARRINRLPVRTNIRS